MKSTQIALSLVTLLSFSTCFAAQDDTNNLNDARKQVAKQYIQNLQNADYKNMVQLFEKNGVVVSTSRGKVDAKDFFYSFLPNIASANTELHQAFISDTDSNRLAARFHFSFKLKDGEEGSGEYTDEFVFADHSSKLTAVYMFENLKFENSINIK